MNYNLHFLPEVEEDLIAGYTWYERKSIGLGEEFLRMFYVGAEKVLRNPQHYPKIHYEFRRHLMKRFPYAIYFTVTKDKIIVYGLFHCARNPSVIKKNLRNR